MRISLILPPHSFEERFNKSIAKAAGVYPPLGILYIAAVLKKNGHEVQVLDGSIKDISYIKKELTRFQPEIIGLNVMTFLYDKVKKWIPEIKEEFPNCFILIGGPHSSVYQERCLEEIPLLDAVILGEGEIVMNEVANILKEKKPLDNIDGLIFRKGSKIQKNNPNKRIENLDELPFPARELIDIYEYIPAIHQYKEWPVGNIITSRGCPYKCIFCGSGNTTAKFRSPENVIEEIKLLVDKYKIKELAIWDDTFTLNKQRVIDICNLLIKEKINIRWSAHSRVNTIDRELLEIMSKAGCWKIFYGAETLVQKNLNTLKKSATVEQIFNAVKWTKEFGIEVETSFVFGIPDQTYQEALETIELIKELDPDYIKCFPLTPLPGTELDDKKEEYGKIVTTDLNKVTENSVIWAPSTMTPEQVKELISLAYKSFYIRPRYIIKYIKKIRGIRDIKRSIKGLIAVKSL